MRRKWLLSQRTPMKDPGKVMRNYSAAGVGTMILHIQDGDT